MDAATFSSTRSHSLTQFVKNRNAEQFSAQYAEAAGVIVKGHYVDDYFGQPWAGIVDRALCE